MNKMYVVGDALISNNVSLLQLKSAVIQKHIKWIKTSLNIDESYSLTFDYINEESQEIANANVNKWWEFNWRGELDKGIYSNYFCDSYLNNYWVKEMRLFEETGSKSNKNESKVCKIDENDFYQQLQNGNIFIYSFLTET